MRTNAQPPKTETDMPGERRARAEARREAREAGHECENRADTMTGEARARELDRAADHFDKAAANPTPGGQPLGHYANRAVACRGEAAAIRNRIEINKRAPVDVDSAIRGATVSGPYPRKRT